MRVRLGDVLRLRKEIVHPRDRPHGRATFVGLEHLESGSGRRTGSLEIDLASLTGRKPRFYTGDIVYGYLRPYLNKVWVAEFDGLCSVDQYVYEVDRSRTEPEYVAWFMRSPFYAGQAPVTTGPGQLPRIRLEEVARVELGLPDLSEQRRVVAAISDQVAAVERARAAAETQRGAADALTAAYLRAAFDSLQAQRWPRRRLGEVSEIVAGITLGRRLSGGRSRVVPYLRVANVKDGYLDLSDVNEIEASEVEIEKLRLHRGDLLLTEGGDPDKLGRGSLWREELLECVHQNHIFRVRFDPAQFVPDFASAQIGSHYGKRYFLAHAKQTTGIATINRKVLAAFPLMTPDRVEQERIAGALIAQMVIAQQLTQALSERVKEIESLREVLLRRAFSGEA